MISPVLSACLLGNVVMAMAVPSHPWRPAMCLSARACFYVCVAPLVPPISLFSLARPACRVVGRGARASEFIVACRGLPRARGGVACFVGDGQLMCRFCGCPSHRLIARAPSGIVFLVPYPRFVDRFFSSGFSRSIACFLLR